MAIQPKKHEMPVQDAKVRARNFKEVALGYTPEIAVAEAQRCLNCKNRPCVEGCPVNISIPEFISKVKESDFEGAYNVISQSSSLPAVTPRRLRKGMPPGDAVRKQMYPRHKIRARRHRQT